MTAAGGHPGGGDGAEALGEDGYTGDAELCVEDDRGRTDLVAVQVTLRGQVDPVAGNYHWYGRVAADPAVTELAARVGTRPVTLRTPVGQAATRLADVDPWGRFRVEGRGHAPFDVVTDVPRED